VRRWLRSTDGARGSQRRGSEDTGATERSPRDHEADPADDEQKDGARDQ
jgi:hypothetical protein